MNKLLQETNVSVGSPIRAEREKRKIALLGKGKTGGAFYEVAKDFHELRVFQSTNPASLQDLEEVDVIVSFLSAPALADMLPLILKSKKPVVSGTTGFPYKNILKENALSSAWITASNFSLGMNLFFVFSKILSKVNAVSASAVTIKEIHHTSKLDSPSGTALKLASVFAKEIPIESERVGDAKGFHELTVSLPGERLSIQHEALSREVFASGALFAMESFLFQLPPGIHRFEDILEQQIRKEIQL